MHHDTWHDRRIGKATVLQLKVSHNLKYDKPPPQADQNSNAEVIDIMPWQNYRIVNLNFTVQHNCRQIKIVKEKLNMVPQNH